MTKTRLRAVLAFGGLIVLSVGIQFSQYGLAVLGGGLFYLGVFDPGPGG